MSKITFELTDTFGGEANYTWARRGEYSGKNPDSRRSVVQAAKRFAGLTGLACDTCDSDDMITVRPYGMCVVLFINWEN